MARSASSTRSNWRAPSPPMPTAPGSASRRSPGPMRRASRPGCSVAAPLPARSARRNSSALQEPRRRAARRCPGKSRVRRPEARGGRSGALRRLSRSPYRAGRHARIERAPHRGRRGDRRHPQFHGHADGPAEPRRHRPMARRKDAGVAMVRLAARIHDRFAVLAGPRTVWTIGRILLDPNAPSIVPGRADMQVQFRDIDTAKPPPFEARPLRDGRAKRPRRPVPKPRSRRCRRVEPRPMDGVFQGAIEGAAERHAPGLHLRMPSGAGHDAQIVSHRRRAGTRSIPSINGVSHHWSEDTQRGRHRARRPGLRRCGAGHPQAGEDELFGFLFAAVLALTAPASAQQVKPAAGPPKVTPAEAREIARDAYIYAYPLVLYYLGLCTARRIDPKTPSYAGGFGHWAHRKLATPEAKDIVTPNVDTPYSYAWVDPRRALGADPAGGRRGPLCREPMGRRSWSRRLPRQHHRRSDGGGSYLLAPPGWKGTLPPGVKRGHRRRVRAFSGRSREPSNAARAMPPPWPRSGRLQARTAQRLPEEACPAAPPAVEWPPGRRAAKDARVLRLRQLPADLH